MKRETQHAKTQDANHAVLRGEVAAVRHSVKERSQINTLALHFKNLEKITH